MGRRGFWADEFGWISHLLWIELIFGGIIWVPCVLLILGLSLVTGYFALEAGRMALKARGWEGRLARGTSAAYAGAAGVDLSLARKALKRGEAATAEARASAARDKLDAPRIAGRGSAVEGDLKSLEERAAKDFRPIRRKRALDRLGKQGAELRDRR